MEAKRFRRTSDGIAVVRRGPALPILIASLVVLGGAVSALFSSVLSGPLFWLIASPSILAAIASGAVALRRRVEPATGAPRSRRHEGKIEIAGDTITLTIRRRRHAYPRAAVVAGWLERLTESTTVVLSLASGEVISVEVDDADEGNLLLAAAGVSADKQVLRSRLAPVLSGGHPVVGCVVIGLSVFTACAWLVTGLGTIIMAYDFLTGRGWWNSSTGVLLLFVLCTAVLAGIGAGLVPPRIVIGNDGVTFRKVLGRRFVPYADVAEVRQRDNAVELVLHDGGVERLVVEERFAKGHSVNPVQQAIFDRIWDAIQSGSEESDADSLRALDRAGRPLAAWRDHLLALGQERGDYRRIALSREDIAAVLSDVEAPRERRVAAALALSQSDDAETKARLRAAADACADEELALALEAAAEDELSEAALEAALKRSR